MESQESGTDQCEGTSASVTQSAQLTANSSMLILPPEIRREVFKHLLINRKSRIEPKAAPSINGITYLRLPAGWHSEIHLAILRTCRSIYEEASKVLYAENTVFLQCRWDVQGECRAFDHLPPTSNFKGIKHLELEIYRWYRSSYLLPVYLKSTLKHLETIGCSLRTLRLKFTPSTNEVQPLAPNGSQTEAAVIEKIADQLCHLEIKQKIEIEFATAPNWKADGDRLQRFIDAIAAKKNWKSRKTTVVLVHGWADRVKARDIGKGILIDIPPTPLPLFAVEYAESDEIVVEEHWISQYQWKWLLREKI